MNRGNGVEDCPWGIPAPGKYDCKVYMKCVCRNDFQSKGTARTVHSLRPAPSKEADVPCVSFGA